MHQVNLQALDLNLLVALDVLLDEVSVSRAARRLGRSQPAVSRMLSRLREHFKDPLLVLVGRGLKSTPHADALKEPLKLLLSDVNRLFTPPRSFDAATAVRTFRLMTSDFAQVVVLGPALRRLTKVAPGIRLEVRSPSATWEAELASGALDLVLATPELAPSWCDQQPLESHGWACVGRAPVPRTLDNYLARQHVAIDAGHRDNVVDEALRRLGQVRAVRAALPDFAGALFVAATTDLLATVPRPVAQAAARMLPVVVAPVPFAVAEPQVVMVWPRRLTRDAGHVWFRNLVVESIGPRAQTAE